MPVASLPLSKVSLVYDYCLRPETNFRQVQHDLFHRFSQLTWHRLRQERDMSPGLEIPHPLRLLNRYAYRASCLPLPFNHPSLTMGSGGDPGRELERLAGSYSDPGGAVHELSQAAAALFTCAQAPLTDAVRSILSQVGGEVCLLISIPSRVKDVEDHFRATGLLGAVAIVTEPELARLVIPRPLIVLGAPRRFSPSVFNAPRSPSITVVAYDWLDLRVQSSPESFIDGIRRAPIKPLHIPRPVAGVDIEELGPSTEWRIRVDTYTARNLDPGEETVTAKAFLLEDESAVLLDSGSQVLAIATQGYELSIMRVGVDELEPGMFVLLRTEGGGDYVVEVAKTTSGPVYALAAESQRRWKGALRQLVLTRGNEEVLDLLRREGARHPSSANLRNWMSERNIRPEEEANLRAILRLVRMEESLGQILVACQEIDAAHRRAGFIIRRNLLRAVRKADMNELERTGVMRFQLGDGLGGSLTAFRIIEPVGTLEGVPASRLMRVLRDPLDI